MQGLIQATLEALDKGQQLSPKITTSNHYKHWVSIEDPKRCIDCEENHGKVYLISEKPNPKPPIHFCCRCSIVPMKQYQPEPQRSIITTARIGSFCLRDCCRSIMQVFKKLLTQAGITENGRQILSRGK